MMAFLGDTSSERMGELLDEAKQLIAQLKENGVTMVAVKPQHSTGLFYFCKSLLSLEFSALLIFDPAIEIVGAVNNHHTAEL